MAECSPSHIRGCLLGIGQPLFSVGILTANVISVGFSNDTTNGWRYIWSFLGVFNLLQFVGLLFLPESPSWLLLESRQMEAKQSLMRLRKEKEDVDEELWEIEANYKQVTSLMKSSVENLDDR